MPEHVLMPEIEIITDGGCQRRHKFPQKCRSKIPHFGGSGNQPGSVIGSSIFDFRRPPPALGWRRR